MSNNKHFADLLKVCSILPALAIMPAMAEVITLETDTEILNQVIENQTITGEKTGVGGVLSYKASKGTTPSLTIKNSQFKNNTRYDVDTANGAYGAALSASGVNVVMENVDFIGNRADTSTDVKKTAKSQGAAYYQGGASFDATGLTVKANETTGNTTGIGTGLFLWGVTSGSLSNSTFENNIAKGTGESTVFESNGGALVLWANGERFNVYNTTFSGNKVLSAANGGGAVSTKGAVTYNNVTFTKNEAIGSDYGNGGAMEVYYTNGDATQTEIEILDSDFNANYASTAGGAIWNAANVKSLVIEHTDFTENKSGELGGAIWNAGKLTLNDVEFKVNSANESGGAIYNEGTLNIADAEFEGNKIIGGLGDGGAIYSDGSLSITNSDFSDNYAKENVDEDVGYGGAIFARGEKVEIKGGEFENNHALTAGAVYISKHALTTTIDGVEFDGNWASDIGALAVMGKDVTLNNLKFANNYTTGDFAGFNDGAGALFFGSESQSKLTGGNFVNNESASRGGAIATRVAQNEGGSKNRNDGVLDIIDSTFVKNTAATDGGAIYNTFYNSVEAAGGAYVAKSSFVGNKATNGGAIYNDGTEDYNGKHAVLNLSDLTFADNIASDKGGAIYNGENATINMSGTNAFTNNTANKGANDIYNAGTLNITGGETTIGGGILGNGTLTLAQGATLDIGNSTIKQGAITIEGTVALSVLSNRSYGRLVAD
ncbi:MAG: hypothetical protein II208_00830, partial [Alphaproteobacteria bacterium]|nr:hypothetical protein [Alphaproteobacteria bacterium]